MGYRLDIIIPVHNEGRSIKSSLEELCRALTGSTFEFRLIVCEDGSSDGSLQILTELAATLPIKLVTATGRKGYSHAVIDGLAASDGDYVAVLEGDGQSDPNAINILLENIDGFDVMVGWRNPRNDNLLRKILSGTFRSLYRRLFAIPLMDPSYACVLIRRSALGQVLNHLSGRMTAGLFWEFNAWCHALKLRVGEVPVPHRARAHGRTRVFPLWKIPTIAISQGSALLGLRREISTALRQFPEKTFSA